MDHGTVPGIALHALVGSAAQLQVRHTLAVTHEAGDLAASTRTGNADGTPDVEANYRNPQRPNPPPPPPPPSFLPFFPPRYPKKPPTVIVK
jgi:hypothetical protein